MQKNYSLPKLPYGYNNLAPYISEEQLRLHYEKHHSGYVNNANALLEKLEKSRKENSELDMKSTLKSLSFNVAGHLLHSLFWSNLAPEGKGGKMSKALSKAIDDEFGSFDRLRQEFTQAAVSVEGSGWAALAYCPATSRLLLVQIEKHNVNVIPQYNLLLVIDVWEHAYYLDYKNARDKFVEAFWKIINWNEVNKRFDSAR
jgi:Fe-Mn family superoxide dismutase